MLNINAGRKAEIYMITIIDYGAGNLHSVKNALDFLGIKSIITGDPGIIDSSDKIILPGVGAFGDAMTSLKNKGLAQSVLKAAKDNRPLLGICLGLQLMFEESEESEGISGLGIFKGKCVRIPEHEGLKIPHMGWNSIEISPKSRLLHGLGNEPYVYFVHSYYLNAQDTSIVSAYTNYGSKLGIAAEKNNIFALQFHPEKSGETGMKILKNFINL